MPSLGSSWLSIVACLCLWTALAGVEAKKYPTRAEGNTYPVPALPDKQASFDSSSYTLSNDFEITDVPTTREYWWTIEAVTGAPDGYPRRLYTVNGQFPGPLIEANTGDRIVVHVTNALDIPTTIHWHGIHQNGTNYMDGVTAISQCAIPPGSEFTYSFTIDGQYGTYWYHSHYSNTLADGIFGPLIVHNPDDELQRGRDYDEDMVVIVNDWYDVVSEVIIQAIRTDDGFDGYNGGGPFPATDAVLVNGVGQTVCNNPDAADPASCNSNVRRPEIPVTAGNSIRLRLINPGTQSMMRVSIDEHEIEVVEADDTPIWGPTIHEVPIGLGQRYSIVVKADVGKVGDVYWFRANEQGPVGGETNNTGLAAFRYVGKDGKAASDQLPDTKPWFDLPTTTAIELDLDEFYTLWPRGVIAAPDTVAKTNILNSANGRFVDVNGNAFNGWGINNITFQAQIGYPLLQQLEDGRHLDSGLVDSVVFPDLAPGDIIVNNLDFFGPGILSHPFHLHGKSFFIVGRGFGQINSPSDLDGIQLNTTNPLRRDTITIPGGYWAVLRMVTDVPGVWPIHCHIGLHLSEGKLAAVVIQPNVIKKYEQPGDWSALCSAYPKNEIDPTLGRRDEERQILSRIVGRSLGHK